VTADSKARLLKNAERYILQGKIQQAILEYSKIVDLDPHDVLILNTIGDLYLRQNKIAEANKYFSQVAENYVQYNFPLKSIAVYKKILKTDPNNLDINLTVASLYARQGLNVDARNQYMLIAALLEQEGKSKESLGVYEKIAALDPSKPDIQRKLAMLYLEAGARDEAYAHFAYAARAQVQAGDLAEAVISFEQAMQLAPSDEDAMSDFLECCIKVKNLQPALQQLLRSVEIAPQNLNLQEMLGRAYLESGDYEAADRTFRPVVSMDESRYKNLFPLVRALIDRRAYDRAITTLDQIIPILISRRETDRAAGLYRLILQRRPNYIPALSKLASLYFAAGDQSRYLQTMNEIADLHLNEKRTVEVRECLENILQADPENERCREMHRLTFMEAHPNTPYVPPVKSLESSAQAEPILARRGAAYSTKESSSDIVEVDLLLNYGLKEKALKLLLALEMRDPDNQEVRNRLRSLYNADKKFAEAAARSRNAEVDLSSDMEDALFSGDRQPTAGEMIFEPQLTQEALQEVPDDFPGAPSKSIQEQLREVDFYIRLGFNDEALGKLGEIAKINPNHPELAERYQKLSQTKQTASAAPDGIGHR
jgi:tetratricopeptide (TPR) repeat protein